MQNETLVYFDMDGVLADFDAEYIRLVGHYTPAPHRDTDWKALAKFPNFFLELPVMAGVRALWDMVPGHRRRILSAVAKRIDACDNHKRDWLRMNFQIAGDPVIIVNDRKQKYRYCWPGDILIDDRSDNIDEWVANGGVGIFFKSSEQAIVELTKVFEAEKVSKYVQTS